MLKEPGSLDEAEVFRSPDTGTVGAVGLVLGRCGRYRDFNGSFVRGRKGGCYEREVVGFCLRGVRLIRYFTTS